jgi:PAS domain S-box-containing protein
MEEYQSEITRIKEILGEHPEGMSITAISAEIGINRNSIAKYMDILQIQGSVDGRKVGTSKIYYLSERLPAASIMRFCTRPLIVINQDFIIINLNRSFSEAIGIPADKLIQQPFEVLPLRFIDGATPRQVLRAALRGMEQRVRAQRMSGTQAYQVTLLFIPVVFENGKPGVSVIFDDNERTGKFSQYNTGLSEIDDMGGQLEYHVRHTSDGVIHYVNETYCRAVGKQREDLVGRKFKPLVSQEDDERITELLAGLTPQYPVGTIEYSAVMANGDVSWQHWQIHGLFNSRGEVTGYNSYGMDITETVNLQQKLKKTQDMLEGAIANRTEELRTINRQLYSEIARREKMEQQFLHTQFAMDNAPDMVFWVNHNARVQYANRIAVQTLGYSVEEILGLSFGDLCPVFTLTRWDSIWEQLKNEGSITLEAGITSKDGVSTPVEIVIKYLEYHGMEFACSFSRNITDRTRMERALQQANKKLNLLTSITRHDIHNKITVLLGYLGRAKKIAKDPQLIEYLERQEKAAREIRNELQITRDFKNLGTDSPVWLNIRTIAGLATNYYEDKPVRFIIDLPDIEIYVDPHLERVFFQIFSNSLKTGQKTTYVRVSANEKEHGLFIIIEDDGNGFSGEEKESLFELKSGGENNDLFIIHEILSLTGLTLQENGVPGQGTRFEIGVPLSYYRIPALQQSGN